jgi:flagellar biosynthetic protein FliP
MHAADVRLVPRIGQRLAGTGHFLGHYLEMVLVMLLGMWLLGPPLRALLLPGHEDPLMHEPLGAYAVAALSMTVPMVAWMRYRGHTWRRLAEMSAAMPLAVVVPLALVWLAATAGLPWPTRHNLPPMMHLGLFSMAALMLRRCREYCHTPTHGPPGAALVAALVRARRARAAGHEHNEHGNSVRLGVLGTLLGWGLVLALVVWGTLTAGASH